MNLGLVYVILEDNFHCYPCYSRFPDPRSEGKKNQHHISKADLLLVAMAGSWFSSFSPRRNKEEPLAHLERGSHRAEPSAPGKQSTTKAS